MGKTRLCSEPECGRPHYGHGLCNMHWQRGYDVGRLRAPPSANVRAKQIARQRLKLTGWTTEAFEAALRLQQNLCALCAEPFDSSRGGKPVADHNHATGRPRGVLHSRCNLAVGQYERYRHRLAGYLEVYDGQD